MRKRGSPLASSSSTEPDGDRLRVGRLGRPNGLQGFLGLYVDEADLEHFETGSHLLVGVEAHTVRALRRGAKGYEVAFEEVTDRSGAEAIRGMDVHVVRRRVLGENEYWPSDLVGLAVRPGGGTVVGVSHGPSQDRLVIERDGETFEVPFVDELVPVVDLPSGFVEIAEIEGLTRR